MSVYVLHFDPPYQHAKHYIGFTIDPTPTRRLWEHLNGQGSPLVKAAVAAGCEVTVVKFWKTGTRSFERWLKKHGGAGKWCHRCGVRSRRMPTMTDYKKCVSKRKKLCT